MNTSIKNGTTRALKALSLATIAFIAVVGMKILENQNRTDRVRAYLSEVLFPSARAEPCNNLRNNILEDSPTNLVSEAEMKTQADPEVERYLKEQQLEFGYCDDGDVRLTFGTGDGRSQQVFVASRLQELDGMKIRKVFSVAYRGRLTKVMANELLRSNYKLGFWHVDVDERTNRELVIFAAQIPWDILPVDFEAVLRRVAEAADKKESEWTDVDEL